MTNTATDGKFFEDFVKSPGSFHTASWIGYQQRAITRLRDELLNTPGSTRVSLKTINEQTSLFPTDPRQQFQMQFQKLLERLTQTSISNWLDSLEFHIRPFRSKIFQVQGDENNSTKPREMYEAWTVEDVQERRRHEFEQMFNFKRQLCEHLTVFTKGLNSKHEANTVALLAWMRQEVDNCRRAEFKLGTSSIEVFKNARLCVLEAEELRSSATSVNTISVDATEEWAIKAKRCFRAAHNLVDAARNCRVELERELDAVAFYTACVLPGEEWSNIRCNFLDFVARNGGSLKNCLEHAESTTSDILHKMESSTLSPCGVAVTRSDFGVSSPDHLGGAAVKFTITETCCLGPRPEHQLISIVYQCLLSGIYPESQVSAEFLLPALTAAEIELNNYVNWLIQRNFPTQMLSHAAPANKVSVRNALKRGRDHTEDDEHHNENQTSRHADTHAESQRPAPPLINKTLECALGPKQLNIFDEPRHDQEAGFEIFGRTQELRARQV